MKRKQTVCITLEGGIVQDVKHPNNVRVVIRYYDIEGLEDETLTLDAHGNPYAESVWEA